MDNNIYVVDGVRFDQNDEAVVRLRNPWQRNNSSLVNENIPVDSSASFVEVRMRNMIEGQGLNILIWGRNELVEEISKQCWRDELFDFWCNHLGSRYRYHVKSTSLFFSARV